MIARYASAATTGTLVTFALLFAMQGLIRLQPGAASEDRSRDFVDWIRMPPPPDPPPAEKPPIERNRLVDAPDPPSTRPVFSGDGVGLIAVPNARPGPMRAAPGHLGAPDSPLTSIVRVRPIYPPSAEQRGIEGWVEVRFDVMPNGLTTNIETIASSHRVFEKAAHEAARRFRYKAPVVDGVPQPATGIEFRFSFTMDE